MKNDMIERICALPVFSAQSEFAALCGLKLNARTASRVILSRRIARQATRQKLADNLSNWLVESEEIQAQVRDIIEELERV